ncbi:MAG: helix-turn-helix transcriptional regulator [Clostridia bacterium]|nr:helix-turn-helix transcriptional regulator [Clostridia bacterium]MBQ9774295.1 helix-turn-helix transcriptional regulator [Clostridia bacterium]
MASVLHYYGEGKGKKHFLDATGIPNRDFLLLITKGRFFVRFPSLDVEHDVRANEGIFIPCGVAFERRISEPIDFHQISFSTDSDNPYYGAMQAGRLAISQTHLATLMDSMHRADALRDEQALIRLLEQLLLEQHLFLNLPPERAAVDETIGSLIEYMNEHLSEKLDMDALASRAYLSHTGLIWKFRRETGTTPLQYLIELRMRRAKELLLTGSLSISEIAERCGYPNAYYFTNAFRKHAGKSPGAFRRNSS